MCSLPRHDLRPGRLQVSFNLLARAMLWRIYASDQAKKIQIAIWGAPWLSKVDFNGLWPIFSCLDNCRAWWFIFSLTSRPDYPAGSDLAKCLGLLPQINWGINTAPESMTYLDSWLGSYVSCSGPKKSRDGVEESCSLPNIYYWVLRPNTGSYKGFSW